LLPGANRHGLPEQDASARRRHDSDRALLGMRAGLRTARHGLLPVLSRPDLLAVLRPRGALPRLLQAANGAFGTVSRRARVDTLRTPIRSSDRTLLRTVRDRRGGDGSVVPARLPPP